jgi:hypothetical protein
MTYILLLVQQYQPSAAQAFLKLEAEFKELERRSPQFPQGKRYQLLSEGDQLIPLSGKASLLPLTMCKMR